MIMQFFIEIYDCFFIKLQIGLFPFIDGIQNAVMNRFAGDLLQGDRIQFDLAPVFLFNLFQRRMVGLIIK